MTAGELEVLIHAHLTASASASIPIDLGAGAQDVGLNISGNINVGTTLTGDLSVGLTTDTIPSAFLVPGGSLDIGVSASVSSLSAAVKLGFLTASITGGSISFGGTVHLLLTDPKTDPGDTTGQEITLSELTGSPGGLVTPSVQSPTFSANLPVSVAAGVMVGSTDLHALSATLSLSMANAADIFSGGVPSFNLVAGGMNPAANLTLSATSGGGVTVTADAAVFTSSEVGQQIFFGGGRAIITTFTDTEHVTVDIPEAFPSTSITSGSWLVGINLLDFSNITPGEVMGMLGQVFDTFVSLAGSSVLKTPIPFTGKSVGDLLDYATTFKTKIIDPLFVSGNSLSPDPDHDGVPDFNFSSIQGLVNQLTTSLGLGSTPIVASFDPSTKELTFAVSFHRALGFGQATVVEAQMGSATQDEKQSLTVNAVASGGTLHDTYRLAFPDPQGNLQFTDDIAYNAPATGTNSVQSKLEALSGIGPGNVAVTVPDPMNAPNVYAIEFESALADKQQPLLVSDASQLAGTFPLNFGASLGSFAGVQTSGSISVAASLNAGLTFGIDLFPSQTIQITPPVFGPTTGATVKLPEGATTNTVQIVTVHAANGGTFTLAYNNNPTSALNFNASNTDVQTALQAVSGITSVSVSEQNQGVDRIYTITFNNPSNPSSLLVAASALTGVADNGTLSAADGTATSATAHFSVQLFNKSFSVSDGTHSAQTINQQSLGTISGVTVAPNTGHMSLADLAADVQNQINTDLVNAGLTLGFLSGNQLTTGALTAGGMATATGSPLSTFPNDLGFTLKLTGSVNQTISGMLRAVDVFDAATTPETSRTLFNSDGTLNMTKLTATVSASILASSLQDAINSALRLSGVTCFTISVGTAGGKLTFSVTAVPHSGDTMELDFTSLIEVDAGGGRLSLATAPVQFSASALTPAANVDRFPQTTAGGYNDTAFGTVRILRCYNK